MTASPGDALGGPEGARPVPSPTGERPTSGRPSGATAVAAGRLGQLGAPGPAREKLGEHGERVEVRCYAGGRGDETPRVVLLGGRKVTVRVERSWIEEPVGSSGTARRRLFQVRLEDGPR